MDLLIERKGAALWLTLNRPQTLNALTRDMLQELRKAILKASADAGLRAIVLTGAGRGFCVGADLKCFQEDSKAGRVPSFRQELEQYFHPVARALRQAPQITIARVAGPCAGAGMALALACDWKFALKEAPFVASFAKVGLGPDTGSSFLVERALGYSKALEFFLLRDKTQAQELESWGLVNKTEETSDALDKTLEETLQRLASLPPQAVVLTKRALIAAVEARRFEESLFYEAAIQDFLGKSEDHAEGMAAFLEKRQPVFKGK